MGFDFTDDSRMQDGQPPNDQAYTNHRGLHVGHRGLERPADVADRAGHRHALAVPDAGARGAVRERRVAAASEGLPPIASLSHGDSFARFAGPQLDLQNGMSVMVVISYVRIGTVVAKLYTAEGNQAPGTIRAELIDGYLSALVRRVRTKLAPVTR